MLTKELIPRVTIFAVGVSYYSDPHLRELHGPEHDLLRLSKLLVENKETALFNPEQLIVLQNPESVELRHFINEYVMSRSAEGDILIFYFSGHGVSIGRDDFGFCTTDTIVHPVTRVTLPLSVVKFSELLDSIYVANVIPIIIIDACYSGIAGKSLKIPPIEAISSMEHKVHSLAASSYALFSSCSDSQTTLDTPLGGIFSYYLFEVATRGLPLNEVNKSTLSLKDIYPKLSESVLTYTGETIPRLFLGPTLPDFPLVINTQFTLRRYSLSPSYVRILEELFNKGLDRSLSPEEIGRLCGYGAYCNHNKLSFDPWRLVETVQNTRLRRLTERGKQFLKGNLSVPKTIMQDPITGEVVPIPGVRMVYYSDYRASK